MAEHDDVLALRSLRKSTDAFRVEHPSLLRGARHHGEARAREYVAARDGGRTLQQVEVAATRTATDASVTVAGDTVHVNIIAVMFPVRQTAHFPVERVT